MLLLDKDSALAAVALEKTRLPPAAEGCVPCAFSRHGYAAEFVIGGDADFAVVLDRFGYREGHLLVAPRRHIERSSALPEGEYLALQRWVHRAMRVVDAHFQPPRIFVAELGSAEPLATGTSFPHVHIHVVPIHQRGEEARPAQVFSWTSGIVAYRPEEAAALVADLRVRLAALAR